MSQVLKCLILGLLFFVSSSSYSQGNEIKIRFIGNCGLYMTDGTENIYIDFPYKSGAHHYMEYNMSEIDSVKSHPIFIYTHKHSDHYSGKLVRRLARKLDGRVYSPWSIKELLKLNTELKDFKIEVFKTKHRFSINHYSYLITWHGKRIFFSGDTENSDTMAKLSDIDWGFMPMWLISDAIRKKVKLKEICKMVVIYHIGPRDTIVDDGEDAQVKLLTKQGEVITIPYN